MLTLVPGNSAKHSFFTRCVFFLRYSVLANPPPSPPEYNSCQSGRLKAVMCFLCNVTPVNWIFLNSRLPHDWLALLWLTEERQDSTPPTRRTWPIMFFWTPGQGWLLHGQDLTSQSADNRRSVIQESSFTFILRGSIVILKTTLVTLVLTTCSFARRKHFCSVWS